jgi:hypothetical protein
MSVNIFENSVMKKLALIAFAAFATSAFAGGENNNSHPSTPTGSPSINVTGNSTQSASLIFSAVRNKAESGSGATAQQNLASNAGAVLIQGNSSQSVGAATSDVSNIANGANAFASQNLASNVGAVTITGNSVQNVSLLGSYVANSAGASTLAVQNIASNNAN